MKFPRTPEHKRLMKMLATARHREGLTQQQLAERIGADRQFIARYESGERREFQQAVNSRRKKGPLVR